jgi:hypothetical protein
MHEPPAHVPTPMVYVPVPWEYRHVVGDLDPVELDRLGTEGWELVAVVNQAGALHFYFKRPGR